ncbi:PhzF family phenazine biosynthesis protein [Nostoc ellipsosporum NOK]|nr:PhzF family phenazine biosynthesis protein [Nostoc ellipsosporum NOK]
MKLTIYQVDAFTQKVFKGNPAAVIPLEEWIDESLMQQIALENNLSDTAFFVPSGNDFEIRWFTPEAEINLCGHATLASAYVLYEILGYDKPQLVFHSPSGPLTVIREQDGLIQMDFPSWKPERIESMPDGLADMLGVNEILGIYQYRDLLVELPTEEDVRKANPDFTRIKATGKKIIITAPGRQHDFVSRFFAPSVGINEDPVTGSAHAQLIPFWSDKLNKKRMTAAQLSYRGGELVVEQLQGRVLLGGHCVFYMQGQIRL